MGLNRNMKTTIARGTSANEGFGKFKSNNGKFDEAVSFNVGLSNGFLRGRGSQSAKKAFVAGSQKANPVPDQCRYKVQGPSAKLNYRDVSGFYNRKTSEPFTSLNGIGYGLEPYERKQDLMRTTQQNFDNCILDPAKPFSHTVIQRGNF